MYQFKISTLMLFFAAILFSETLQSFIKFGSFEYYIERKNPVESFSQAQSKCEKMKHAELVVIKTSEIRNFLLKQIGNLPRRPYSFYIGLKRTLNGDQFEWLDRSILLPESSYWSAGEPNSGSLVLNHNKREDCVIMGWTYELDRKFKWRDIPCRTAYKSLYICQRPVIENYENNKEKYSNAFLPFNKKSTTTYYLTEQQPSTAAAAIPATLLSLLLVVAGLFVFLWYGKKKKLSRKKGIISDYPSTKLRRLPRKARRKKMIDFMSHFFIKMIASELSQKTLNQKIQNDRPEPHYEVPTVEFADKNPKNNNHYDCIQESPTSSKIYYEIGTEKTAPSTNDILCLDAKPHSSAIYSEVSHENIATDATNLEPLPPAAYTTANKENKKIKDKDINEINKGAASSSAIYATVKKPNKENSEKNMNKINADQNEVKDLYALVKKNSKQNCKSQ